MPIESRQPVVIWNKCFVGNYCAPESCIPCGLLAPPPVIIVIPVLPDFTDLIAHNAYLEGTPPIRGIWNYVTPFQYNFTNVSGSVTPIVRPTTTDVTPIYEITPNLNAITFRHNLSLDFGALDGVSILNTLTTNEIDTSGNLVPVFNIYTSTASNFIRLRITGTGQWRLEYGNQIWAIVNFLNGYTPDVSQDYASVIDLVNNTFTLYIDGVFEFTSSIPDIAYPSQMFLEIESLNLLGEVTAVGTTQLWQKALTPEEISGLHPNGNRSPLRSATPKDTLLGYPFMVTAEDNTLGYRSSSLGSLTPIVPLTANVPAVVNGQIEITTASPILAYQANGDPLLAFPKYSFFVANFTTVPDGFKEIYRWENQAGGVTVQYELRFFNTTQIQIVRRSANATNNSEFKIYTTPLDFFNGEDKEIGVVLTETETRLFINGVEPNFVSGDTISASIRVLNFAYIGSNSGFAIPMNVKLFYIVGEGTYLTSGSYTAAHDDASNIARFFYQMGFNKSLTAIEPNNEKLLSGDFPI